MTIADSTSHAQHGPLDADDRSVELTTDRFLVPHHLRHITDDHEFGGIENLGVYASEDVAAGTICVVIGGYVTPGPDFRKLGLDRQRHSLQIGDDLFLTCGENLCDGDMINHSCEPSMGFIGEITLVALHDIAAGEQFTFDYATCDSYPYDEFECECGAASCRGKVTGEDWLRPEIQEKYAGHFSPYLQRAIDRVKAGAPSPMPQF